MAIREHPNDIILIKNVDENCNEVNSEIIRKDRTQQDENGHNFIAYEEVLEEWGHIDGFQVKFDGYPHRVKPGATKRMPRYLAEHFAKHLATHMLQKIEVASNKVGLVNSALERPKMLKTIVLGVEEYFYDNEDNLEMERGAMALREVDRLNRGTDLGSIEDKDPVPNKALGKLETEAPPESLEEVLAHTEGLDEIPAQQRNESIPVLDQPQALTKKELVEAAVSQGVQVTGKETKEELAGKIKATIR